MAIDYSAGLSEDREYVFAEQPADPEMRESVNTWVWDDGTDFGMPRIGVEAVADQWETHDIQFNLAFADGRVLNMFGSGKVHDPLGADGKPRILGAGPIEFELVKPFEHWKAHIRGDATVTTIEAQIGGAQPGSGTGEVVPVELEYDIRSAAPPWESGSLLETAGRVLATQEEGDLMGGPRFEQLFRTTGTLRVGDTEYRLDGVPERSRLRAVPLPAARRRQGHLQRGVPVRGRRRADPRVGDRRTVAARPEAQGPGHHRHAGDGRRSRRDHHGHDRALDLHGHERGERGQ